MYIIYTENANGNEIYKIILIPKTTSLKYSFSISLYFI